MAWRNISVRFGAVAVGIGLDPATERDSAPSAHRYDRSTRERVKQAWTTDGESIAADTFLAYEADALDIDGRKGELIEAERVADDAPRDFLVAASIAPLDPVWIDSDYIVAAGKESGEGCGLLAGMLQESGAWLAGTVRLTDRKRSAILRYSDAVGSLVLSTLRYRESIRWEKAASYGASYAKPSALVLEQGRALFGMLAAEDFAPLDTDNVNARLRAAIEGTAPSADVESSATSDGDALLAAMRETLSDRIERESGGKAKQRKSTKRGAAKS